MTTAQPLVLITGATGFLGFLTLLELLRSGYRVRAAVRSEDKIDKIRTHPLVSALTSQSPAGEASLSFNVIPDLAAPGAFDWAVQGANYVIHLAAPVPSFSGAATVPPEQYEQYFVQDAVQAALGILKSSAETEEASVKRIILTSSAVAVIPFAYLGASPDVDYSVLFGPESRQPTRSGPFGSEIEAYSAGKTAVLNAVEEWVDSDAQLGERASFDIVSVLSGWTFGRDELVRSAEELRTKGTNSVLLGLLLGNKSEWPFNGNAVLAADVARVHVLSLNAPQAPSKSHSQTFVTSTPIVWEDAVEVVRSEFAADVEAGRLSVDGKQPTQPIHFDGSKTEKVLGIKFAPFHEAVRQVAGQYLELLDQA